MNSKEKVLELRKAFFINKGDNITIEKQVLGFLIDYNLELDESLKFEVERNTELMKRCNAYTKELDRLYIERYGHLFDRKSLN